MGRIENEIESIAQQILEDYKQDRAIDRMENLFDQPDKDEIIGIVDELMKIMYPGYYRDKSYKIYHPQTNLALLIEDVMYHLNKQITVALRYDSAHKSGECTEACAEECTYDCRKYCTIGERAEEIAVAFMKKIPQIREYLDMDLQAALDGDPAASCKEEIILSYPGFYAITVNRIAHELFLLSVPLIPRIMTEHAHSLTGIDIHPGATIGKYFFIDHGTGIVIGETTEIGDNVKVYQGVTLGALSTRGGQKLRGTKRHPKIEDNVTIYAGASILGGETVIGKNSVIGSNAFLTKSVEEGSRISGGNQEIHMGRKKPDEAPADNTEEFPWIYII